MNTRIDKLTTTLMRGLDMRKQHPDHDGRFIDLLREYEALVDEARGTCLRPARRRVVEQPRLGGIR